MIRSTALLTVTLGALLSPFGSMQAASLPSNPPGVSSRAAFRPERAPLLFEANRGQAGKAVKFLAHTPQGVVTFSEAEIDLPCEAGKSALALSITGANSPLVLAADELSGGVANYYLGRDPSHWIRNVPLQRELAYRSTAPAGGAALIFHGVGGALEYDLEVSPGGNPSGLSFRPSSGARFHIQTDGSATLDSISSTGCHPLRFHAPSAFQRKGDARIPVPSSFALDSTGALSFKVGAYDGTAPLTIDPVVSYTTGIATSNTSSVSAIQVDASGDLFVAGQTYASNYPVDGGGVPGAGDSASEQVFVSEFDPTGTRLLYSTYLPASDFSSTAAVALDAAGNAYVAGSTDASNFPNTSQILGGCTSFCNDGFVVKLSPTGALIYSTLLGFLPKGVVVDGSGSAYIAGLSSGPGLQTVNAFQPSYNGQVCTSCTAPFFGKLTPDGTQWVFASYFGTFDATETLATSIALDSAGDIYLAGNGTGVPLKHSLEAGIGGSFVAEFAPDGQSLLFSTLLGGNTFVSDTIGGLQVGSDGTIFVAGSQIAEDFPYTVTAYRHPTYPIGYAEARTYIFASAINPQHTGFAWSTFLGQGYVDATAIDTAGNFYLGGTFSVGSVPYLNPLALDTGGGPFLLELNPAGAPQFATGLGGISTAQIPSGIAVDANGAIYVAGALTGAVNSVGAVQDEINVGPGPILAPQLALGLNPAPLSIPNYLLTKIIPAAQPQVSLSATGPVLALRNAGSADLHIASIVPGSGISSLISTCGSTVPAGTACYLTPLSPNPDGNTLTVNSDAQPASQTFSPQNLSSNPGAQLIVDGSQLDFPPTENGTVSAARPLVITNAGSAPATVTSILTFGGFEQTSNCGAPLGPGASCTALITVSPTSTGSISGDIGIVTGSGTRSDLFASFIQNPSDGPLLISTDQYGAAFGTVIIGNTALLRTITVTNSGTTPVTVADPTITGANAPDFTLAANTCAGTMLAPGGSCVLGVTFTPSAAAYEYASLAVTGGGSSLTTGLTGTGVAAPLLTVAPTAPNFGQLAVGSTSTLPLQLTNTGTAAITLTHIQVSLLPGTTATDFSQTNNCSATLAPQASCTVTLSFTASTTGARSGDLSLLLNGGIVSEDIALTGTGVSDATPTITFTIPNQTFGAAPVTLAATSSSTAALAYTVVSGPATVSGNTLTLTGAGTVVVSASQPATQAFAAANATATFVVAQAVPQITWATPASIPFGTALGAPQLNATASVPGSFTYNPPAGTIPSAGNQTLSTAFVPQDSADYTTANGSVTLVVTRSTPAITWPAPAAITYGTALSATQLDASASVPGTFTYSPAAGSVPAAGTLTLTAGFNPTDTADQATGSATATLTVAPAPLTVAAASATRLYGAANPAFTATLTGITNGDTLTAAATSSASALSNVGTYTIVPQVTGPSLGNYTITPVNGTLTVTQAGTGTGLSSSAGTSPLGTAVTFTAAVTSQTTGAPTGSVQFQLASTTLATVPLTAGSATYTTSTLTQGANSLTAIYSGDPNFKASQSAQLTETVVVPDFSVAVTPATLSIARGTGGTATFTVTPVNGFAQPITFGCGALPPGITCTFAPATVTPSGTPVSSVLTVTAAAQTAAALTSPAGLSSNPHRGPGLLRWSLVACLLPLLARRRRRLFAVSLALLLFCGLASTSGCGGGSAPPVTTGGAPLGNTQLTVTASSSAMTGGLQHAANLTLTITQ